MSAAHCLIVKTDQRRGPSLAPLPSDLWLHLLPAPQGHLSPRLRQQLIRHVYMSAKSTMIASNISDRQHTGWHASASEANGHLWQQAQIPRSHQTRHHPLLLQPSQLVLPVQL